MKTSPSAAQNRTKPYKPLTPNQRTAAELLASGRNDREVAEAIGVRRATVCQWRHEPEFAAELESNRQSLWSPYVDRLQSLLPRAVEVIEWQALTEKDLKLAFKLLELVGLDAACRSTSSPPPLHSPVAGSGRLKDHLALQCEFEELTGFDPIKLGRPDSPLAQRWMRHLEHRMARQVGDEILQQKESEAGWPPPTPPDKDERVAGETALAAGTGRRLTP